MANDLSSPTALDIGRQIGEWSWSDDQQRAMAEQAFRNGLAITRPDGTKIPIPLATAPVIVADAELDHRAALARDLASAAVKVATWRLQSNQRDDVLAALGPTEQRVLASRIHGEPETLAVMRVDCLGTPSPMALEVNATIPAMQGYADIAAAAWLSQALPGHSALPRLIRSNGSNVAALLQALLFTRMKRHW
ncbi:MAG: hypothetical protein IPK97_05625 [Ahniella sp.]|nr:hypothetical protein [Ahniella sp.]